MSKDMRFVVSGVMQVQGRAIHAADGSIVGYKQKDGSIVKLVASKSVTRMRPTTATFPQMPR